MANSSRRRQEAGKYFSNDPIIGHGVTAHVVSERGAAS